ncbi:MAG: hypothetical protein JSW21_03275 [Gammaproteobacteria bacterium]|nr:MAG: hypothetical protein JSW21_03275 [Gammaproteobacteria bacterium]
MPATQQFPVMPAAMRVAGSSGASRSLTHLLLLLGSLITVPALAWNPSEDSPRLEADAVTAEAGLGEGDSSVDREDGAAAGSTVSDDSGAADTAEEVIHPEVPEDLDHPHHKPNGFQRAMDMIHSGISAGVEGSAKRVDSFFADDRYYTDATDTYVRVSGETTFEGGEDNQSQARVRARFDLPGTRERLRLFVEGGDPDEVESDTSESIPEALDDNDYNIGLETQIRDTGKWDLRPGLGVKASSSPDAFVRLRAVRYERLDGWLLRFATGVSEFVDDGTEVGARLDFDRKINPKWLFRTTSRARYLDSKDRIEALQQFSVFQKYNDRVGFAYDIGVLGDDDPDWEVDQYFTQVRARFRAYKKWLFVELKPQVVFREEDDYDPSFLFSLRLDLIFGERYREGRRQTLQPAKAEDSPASFLPGP